MKLLNVIGEEKWGIKKGKPLYGFNRAWIELFVDAWNEPDSYVRLASFKCGMNETNNRIRWVDFYCYGRFEYDVPRFRLRIPDRCKNSVRVSAHYASPKHNRSGNGGYVPRDDRDQYIDNMSINVSGNKRMAVVARDIKRRFIPRYIKQYEKSVAWAMGIDGHHKRQELTQLLVAGATGATVSGQSMVNGMTDDGKINWDVQVTNGVVHRIILRGNMDTEAVLDLIQHINEGGGLT